MIIDVRQANILDSEFSQIAFAVNVEGYNDAGLAGVISCGYWPELQNTGGQYTLGAMLSKKVRDKTFYALVCHRLAKGGWKNTPQLVEKGLNRIPGNKPLSVALIGGGLVGQQTGADIRAILGGMARSTKQIVVFYL